MLRFARYLAVFTFALVLASCGEAPTATGDAALRVTKQTASVVPGTCTTLAQLNQLAAVIFTARSSPNINSVKAS
jgi:PBP1b-binding outer membrane lipoprotein LpoB